ncbi:tRNA (adenosine(37)-N6)-dimethylallyltransferase MiaA [soil metagenome]
MPSRPVLITGPTASGKSELALTVAERDGGGVVNADALQVYAGWQLLTARPGREATARAPHALYGHVPGHAPYSVGHWLRDVAGVLEDAARRGRRPVIVGGTGLYMSALTEGLSPIPPVDRDVRRRADALMQSNGLADLRDDLAARDAETAATIDLANPARVQRAWEVLEATGCGLAAWRRVRSKPLVPREMAVCAVVNPEPARLAERIGRRFEAMLAAGALEEVRRALAEGWNPRLAAAKALGAAELVAYLRGETGLDAAAARSVGATRRFAKRQRTWFRGRMADWQWLDPGDASAAALADAVPRR